MNTVTKTWSLEWQGQDANDIKWLSMHVNSAEIIYSSYQPFPNMDKMPIVWESHILCTTVSDTQELLLTLKYSDAVLTNVSTEDMRSAEYPVVYTSTQ